MQFSLFAKVIFLILFFIASASYSLPKKHTISFGGAYGLQYYPNYLEVIVGDTIEWKGDFSTYWLVSSSVPSGASTFTADSVPSFQYVVRFQGEYDYQNPIYYSVGMKGSIVVDTIKHGLTNEGREFYLGMLYPNLNTIFYLNSSIYFKHFLIYAMINSYYENDIQITHYDESGNEIQPTIYHVSSHGYLKIPMDPTVMQMDTTAEQAAYRSYHIVSKMPITIEYLSVGACSGGSYLALPVISLGKKYVVASYNDNPGDGSASIANTSAGEFLIIGTTDNVNVQITPTTSTIGGHSGVFMGTGATGNPQPYVIQLHKGQCYLVRSNGHDSGNDISGSIVESSEPIVVIGGHENANLGGSLYEARDFMIEQMVPYEFWDSAGYISIPFEEPKPPGDEGQGDTYRIYAYDTTITNVHLSVTGISGGYDFSTKRFLSIPEKSDVTGAVEVFSTNGHKFSVMQYDERSFSPVHPDQNPAPSMGTVVPRSRWKKFYSFTAPNDNLDHHYINVLSSNLDDIKISSQGQVPVPLNRLSRILLFGGISGSDISLFGAQYNLPVPLSTLDFPFYLVSEYPFMVYYYGDWIALQDSKSEYVAPAGMQLNSGVAPYFKISIDSSQCTLWHFCVSDTSKGDPGIKSVMLIDDPDGVYFEPGEQLKNVSFDTTLTYMPNELRSQGVQEYCFDVKILDPLLDAFAPVAIIDNGGNAVLLNFTKIGRPFKLSTNPPASSRADSIVFPVEKIGQGICTTFVFKNSAPTGGTPINLTSAGFTNNDTSYKIQAITPSLPHSVIAGDSLTLQVCYTPADSSRHRDSLIMKTDCFSLPISLDAHGSTGLISAPDLDFGSEPAGNTMCKTIQIKNVGSAPFMLTGLVLSDSLNFSASSSTLPVQLKPGNFIPMNICFHPQVQGSYTAGIDWTTDLESSFAHSIKSHTAMSGIATPQAGVASEAIATSFSIHPNPSNGNSIVVTFSGTDFSPFGKYGRTEVRPTGESPTMGKATLSMFDVLGREVYHQDILSGLSEIQIPIRNLSEGVYYMQLTSAFGTI